MMTYIRGRLLQANDADYRHGDYGHIDPFYALPFGIYRDSSQAKRVRLAILDLSHKTETYFYSNIELNDIFDMKIDIGIYCQSYITL